MNASSYSPGELEKLTKQELIALLLAQRRTSDPAPGPSTPVNDRSGRTEPVLSTSESAQKKDSFAPDTTSLYRQMAKNFPHGAIAVLSREGRYQFIAGQELEKIGKTPNDFLGKPIGVLPIQRKTKKVLIQAFQSALLGKSCELIEVSFQDNTYLICVIPLTTADGEITQVMGILQNITDQKRTLQEAQYQQGQLESLIESVDDPIWSVDPGNRLMLANAAFYRSIRLLYQIEVRPGQKLHEQITEEIFFRPFRPNNHSQKFLEEWYHCQQRALQGEKLTIEFQYPFRPGDVNIRVSFSPVYDEQRQVIGATFYAHDVSDLREALRQARENEQQYKALAENIPGVVYLAAKQPNCRCIYINEQVEKLTGYSSREFTAGHQSIRNLLHPEDRRKVRQEYIQAQQEQRPYHFDYRLKQRNGEYRWVEEHGTILKRDRALIFQGVILDINEKRLYAEKLENQNQHLRKINAELDYFAYSVSHDLRSPLTSAMGLLMLLQQETDRSQQQNYIEIINKNLNKLDTFIQDIILLSKNARTEVDINEIYFHELLSDVIESQKYGIEFDQVRIDTQIADHRPFYSDRRRLKIILNNLISNALKYSFSRRDQPFARITITVEEAEVLIQVQDNGIGIQDEHLPRIFNMFYRGTDRKSGSGLGLYLVKETLDKLGGHIQVASVYGEGTTFTVRVPAIHD